MERPRVRIRPVTDDDLPLIEQLYDEARASEKGELLAIERSEEPGAVGLLDYRAGEPAQGWLTFGFVAVAAGHRGRGYGSEAVRLVESQPGVERFRAAVDVANGLGLYFWLRLGYRPARPGEFGWPAGRGIIWMVRERAPWRSVGR